MSCDFITFLHMHTLPVVVVGRLYAALGTGKAARTHANPMRTHTQMSLGTADTARCTHRLSHQTISFDGPALASASRSALAAESKDCSCRHSRMASPVHTSEARPKKIVGAYAELGSAIAPW